MRLYLDTNVLTFLVTGQQDRIGDDARELITDYANTLHTSVICLHELSYLLATGKVKRGREWKGGVSVADRVREFGISIEPVTERHVRQEETLPLLERHKDPIVAQAICDRATLLSSDKEFPRYRKYGLILVENTP